MKPHVLPLYGIIFPGTGFYLLKYELVPKPEILEQPRIFENYG
jgi:hypothetical protein